MRLVFQRAEGPSDHHHLTRENRRRLPALMVHRHLGMSRDKPIGRRQTRSDHHHNLIRLLTPRSSQLALRCKVQSPAQRQRAALIGQELSRLSECSLLGFFLPKNRSFSNFDTIP